MSPAHQCMSVVVLHALSSSRDMECWETSPHACARHVHAMWTKQSHQHPAEHVSSPGLYDANLQLAHGFACGSCNSELARLHPASPCKRAARLPICASACGQPLPELITKSGGRLTGQGALVGEGPAAAGDFAADAAPPHRLARVFWGRGARMVGCPSVPSYCCQACSACSTSARLWHTCTQCTGHCPPGVSICASLGRAGPKCAL